MKNKKTIHQIMKFNDVAAVYMVKNPADNRLCVAIKGVQKQFAKLQEDFNEKLDYTRLDCCAVDANGVILLDEKGNYKFTIEGMKKLKPLIKELNNSKLEINTRILDNIKPLIAKLTDEEKNTFSGFVIPEVPVKEE